MKFWQLAEFRNGIRRSRSVDEITRSELPGRGELKIMEGSIAMRKLIAGMVLLSLFDVSAASIGRHQSQPSSKVTVYVEGSTVSSFSGSGNIRGGSVGGTTEPQTIEVMKQLRQFCPDVQITSNRTRADYLILHERQAGGTSGGNRNNIAVFGKDDLLVYADGAQKLDNSVKDLCKSGILNHP